MKKQKLHLIARFAALTVLGAVPAFGASSVLAQQTGSQGSLPPIVRGEGQSMDAPSMDPRMETSRRSDANRSNLPPIVSGLPSIKPAKDSATRPKPPIVASPKPTEKVKPNLLAPIGSGVVKNAEVKQVTAQSNSAEGYRIARAFSPAKMPVKAQGSGSRNSIAPPAIALPNPIQSAPSFGGQPEVSMPLSSSAPVPPVVSGTLVSPGMSMPISGDVMGSAPIVSDSSYFDSGSMVTDSVGLPSVVGGCNDCDGAGGCDSCGPGGCYNPNRINCDYGTFGSVSSARRYGYIEALIFTREDGDITNSNFSALGDFDEGFGWRVTLGQRPDMTQGREISYFGTSNIEATQTVTDDRLRLNALFTAGGGLVGGDLSSFFGAETHTQFKDSTLHSIESNRVRWGWDVLKSFVGWRYIYFADDYSLTSTAPRRDVFNNPIPGTSETGQFRIDTNNHLIGGHIGAELFYDIGYRFSISGVSKFGVFANLNKVDFFLENDGFEIIDSEDNSATLSTSYELQLMAHYQLRQTSRLRFGYNAMFLGDVATVSDNFSGFVSPFTGFGATDSDDAFFQGVSFGLEIYR